MNEETHAVAAESPYPTGDALRSIIDRCKKETKIGYPPGGGFFKPKLKGINHLEVGRSKIISNPLTIILEWLLLQWIRLKRLYSRVCSILYPRFHTIHCETPNSRLVGRIVFKENRGEGAPVHHLHLEFWGRTRLGGWRKLSEGRTDADGNFALSFDLLQARRFWIRSVRFEIYRTSRVYFERDEPKFHYDLYKKIPLPKKDLIGLDYNLRTIQLDYWRYRENSNVPRSLVPEDDSEEPEVYSEGRKDALLNQIIPIELTKLKHLEQIRLVPDTITIESIQEDYPLNLSRALERELPGFSRSDEWFGERMMNGMNRGYFQPDAEAPGKYWIKYFGKCWYDSNDIYALPDVYIRFGLRDNGLPLPEEIHTVGVLNRHEKDPWKRRVFTPSDGERWLQAKRIARVNGAVSTEVDEHFTGTHLNTEQFAVAAYRNLRLNPLAGLLLPHLKEVSLVDHTADKILIGGFIPSATALTEKGLLQRTRDILGCLDWKGWKPMQPISEGHKVAKAECLFWKLTGEYVDDFFERRKEEIRKHWLEVYRFSEDLINHSVPVFLTAPEDAPPVGDHRWGELAEERRTYYEEQYGFDPSVERPVLNGVTTALSRVTSAKTFEEAGEEDWQNLKDVSRYAIMMATFMHTWINEHQYDDVGEIRYAGGGLRFGESEDGILSPEDDDDIAPELDVATTSLWFANILSRTEYGFITRNEEGDVNPRFADLLEAHRDEFASYDVDIDTIESRTNI